jgi:phage/plasmid-like protein (TIGR03299 family)
MHAFTPGQGFFVRQPSWHQLEGKILADWPTNWDEARVQAGLNLWEPESVPIYEIAGPPDMGATSGVLMHEAAQVPGYQRIIRSDNRLTLGIQTSKYRMITNTEFGGVIESILGAEIDLETGKTEEIKYEGVFELYEGRQIFAVIYLGDAITIPGDISPTYRYAVFYTRHDGQGGLRCVITNVRVVCANTAKMSEAGAKEEETSFSIQHSANWNERVAEVRDKAAEALQANQRYYELCAQLATAKVTPATMEKMIKRLLPVGDDMGARQQQNRENEREVLRTLIKGPTISPEHQKTPYGFLMAATEWSDHYRGYRSASSYVTRQLVSKEPLKTKAFSLAKQFAGVK